jgi:hypothetical protein
MPYCPNCHEEYEEGMSACINCGADLVDSPLDEAEEVNLDAFESVFVGPVTEAFEIKSSLEDEGFRVVILGMDESQLTSFELSDEDGAIVKLLVPAESAEDAARRIETLGPLPSDPEEDPSGFPDPADFEEEAEEAFDLEEDLEAPEPAPVPEGPEPETGRKRPASGKRRARKKTGALSGKKKSARASAPGRGKKASKKGGASKKARKKSRRVAAKSNRKK